MYRRLVVLLAVLGAGAVALAPSAGARGDGGPGKYKITIHYSAKQDRIYGTIVSPHRDCYDTRALYVYFWDGDDWVGQLHTSNSSGKWIYEGAMGGVSEGKYYAKAPADKATGCAAVKSETIRVR